MRVNYMILEKFVGVRREKSLPRNVQDEMFALWLFLFKGLLGELHKMKLGYVSTLPDGSPAWRVRQRFDDEWLKQLEGKELIQNGFQ